MLAIAIAALAAPAPYEAAQNITPKAREPFFAPALAPCDAGFTPTCEQAKGFGLCDAASSACDTTCVDEVKKACPVTCSLAPEETSGHELWTTGAAPPDYDQPAPAVAKEIICHACRDHPDLPCCHNHPHDRKDRRLAQQCADAASTITIDRKKSYNCRTREVFTPNKQKWCCKHESLPVGCTVDEYTIQPARPKRVVY